MSLIRQNSTTSGGKHRLILEPGTAKAGFPSPAADDLEREVDPIEWVIRNPASTFWWRVQGDCLLDVGILDGDLIAVDRSGKRRIGRAVLAVVDGCVTAKILNRTSEGYVLSPANTQKSYPDIPLTAESDVWGVIAGIVRRYPIE